MPEDVLECPLCGGRNSVEFDRRSFRGQSVFNRLCSKCGLVYQSPRMTAAEAAQFYQAEYRQMYQGQEGPVARDFPTQRTRGDSLLGFVQPEISAISSHLDIGCSTGLVLLRFQQKYGCSSAGIEPGQAYREYASRQGLAVFATLEELEGQAFERFSLVSMAHVLEHMPDPVGYLVHLREHLLDPQGCLLLEVPNLYAHDSFEPAHLVSFSPNTLVQVVNKAGFEVVKKKEHGQPRSSLLPLYITVLARPDGKKKPIHSERMVPLHRRGGMLLRRVLERLFPRRAWLPEDQENQ